MSSTPGDTSEAMRWNVILSPIDDLPRTPTAEAISDAIRACVKAFRERLKGELRRGRVVTGWGPTEDAL